MNEKNYDSDGYETNDEQSKEHIKNELKEYFKDQINYFSSSKSENDSNSSIECDNNLSDVLSDDIENDIEYKNSIWEEFRSDTSISSVEELKNYENNQYIPLSNTDEIIMNKIESMEFDLDTIKDLVLRRKRKIIIYVPIIVFNINTNDMKVITLSSYKSENDASVYSLKYLYNNKRIDENLFDIEKFDTYISNGGICSFNDMIKNLEKFGIGYESEFKILFHVDEISM